MMPFRYTSNMSQEDAAKQADAGIRYDVIRSSRCTTP